MFTSLELIRVSGSILTICSAVVQYIQKIGNADATLVVFAKEVDDFSVALANIRDTLQKLGVSEFIQRCGRQHWDAIGNSLRDIKESLQHLELGRPDPRVAMLPLVLRRTKNQMRLESWNAVEIELRRKEVSICRQMMILSLNMVQVYILSCKFADNSTSLARQETQLEEIRSMLKGMNSTIQSSQGSDMIKHSQSSFLSANSSVRGHASQSGQRGPSPDDHPRTIDYKNNGVALQRKEAVKKLEAAQYAEAAILLNQVLEKSNKLYGSDYYWRETTQKMAVRACWEQGKWDEAERHLLQISADHDRTGRPRESADTKRSLALLALTKRDFSQAEFYCQQALEILQNWGNLWDYSVYESMELMVDIFQATNDHVKAAEYQGKLKDEMWRTERNEIEKIRDMSPFKASVEICNNYLVDLLPSDHAKDERWKQIRKNIRNRKVGSLCGSGHGYNLLHAVVEFGQEHTIRYLLDVEQTAPLANPYTVVDVKDHHGNAPLHLAARNRRLEAARLFLTHGADINIKSNNLQTPLIVATTAGDLDIVCLLLDHHANFTAKDQYGWQAIHHAVFESQGEIIELLLEKGAEVGVLGAGGRTPLHCAAGRGREDVVQLLLEKGANPRVRDDDDKTPLDLAAKRRNNRITEILREVIQSGTTSTEDSRTEFSESVQSKISPRYLSITNMERHPLEMQEDSDKYGISHLVETVWSAPRFVRDPSLCRGSFFPHALSLTLESDGVRHIVVAETMQTYIHKTWGAVGETVLEIFLESVLAVTTGKAPWLFEKPLREESTGIIGGLKIAATFQVLSIRASCPAQDLLALRECVTWLEQTVGCPQKGLKIRRSTTRIMDVEDGILEVTSPNSSHRAKTLEWLGIQNCQYVLICFGDEEDVNLKAEPFNLCWTEFFECGYVATRSIPKMTHDGQGLAIRFELLSQLAAVERWVYSPTIGDSGIVLTGFNTALIPTRRINGLPDAIQWHFVVQENNIPITRNSPLFNVEPRLFERSFDKLQGPAFVGWGRPIHVVLGTEKVCGEIQNTGLSEVRQVISRFPASSTTGGGSSFGGVLGGSIGNFHGGATVTATGTRTLSSPYYRPIPRQKRSNDDNYESWFDHAYNSLVVVCDVGIKMAWLVPHINLILYMIRQYIVYAQIKRPIDIRYPTTRDGSPRTRDQAAWKEIAELKDLYLEDDQRSLSKTTKRKFGELFIKYAEQLEHSVSSVKSYVHEYGVPSDHLCGVELIDIYEHFDSSPKSLPKTEGIPLWCSLLGTDGVIFGKDLGVVLRVSGSTNEIDRTWPNDLSGQYPLYAKIGDLRAFLEKRGCSNEQWTLHGRTGYIERPGVWRWTLRGRPFDDECTQHRCSLECWKRKLQAVAEGNESHEMTNHQPPFQLQDMTAGLCFGKCPNPETA
jgi:ankyrin repeat protein